MPSAQPQPNDNPKDSVGSLPRPNRDAARYEAHQELHNAPSATLHKIITDYESRQGFEALAFTWNAARAVVEGEKCLTDMPDIRYEVAKAIFAKRFG